MSNIPNVCERLASQLHQLTDQSQATDYLALLLDSGQDLGMLFFNQPLLAGMLMGGLLASWLRHYYLRFTERWRLKLKTA